MCARARAHASVSRWHLSVCSPTTVPVGVGAGAWQQDQFEPGKTLTVKCTVNLLLVKVHAAMQTWHSGIDKVSIPISAALEMESGSRRTEQDSTTIHMNCTINSNRVSQP